MPAVTFIGLGDQPLVKPLLAAASLVAAGEQDCSPLGVESKSDAPLTICRLEAKLLHVGVVGAFQRVDMRPARCRAEFFDEDELGEAFILHHR